MLRTPHSSIKVLGLITIKDIEAARARIATGVRVTPVMPAKSPVSGSRLLLKLENMQLTGSFKERGALNKLELLRERKTCRAVVAASAGNHAQAVSAHGVCLGFDVTIVMPEVTALTKVLSTQRWGAKVELVGATFDAATEYAKSLIVRPDQAFLHAFDDEEIVAGQGTLGLEILDQVPDVGIVVLPVGGGGHAGGAAMALKERNPKIRIIGVQAERYPYSYRAFKGEPSGAPKESAPPTIGDGISMKKIGQVTQPLLQKYLDDMVTVTEEEMANAILHLLETSKVLAEGAGAAALAALMTGKVMVPPQSIIVASVSGGNIDVNVISRIIEKGLIKSHRLARLSVSIPDRPGGLRGLTTLLADLKANILQIHHERASSQIGLDTTGTDLTLETRGEAHVKEIVGALKKNGYDVTLVE